MTTLNVTRIYLRVSTEDQDLQRQEAIIGKARTSGYYVAAVYREKASALDPTVPSCCA
ncbi:Stability/partitioning determinant [Pseudomonas amygdali pv. lachrymans]|nr:Stability/partitioning determinant [Pseudomonas amygdali pv. lachrymans]